MNWVYVFVGGGIGSVLRFGIGLLAKELYGGVFPLGTLLANILSCALMGWVLYQDRVTDGARMFLLAGVCGGFSTFSTFSFDNVELAKSGNWWMVGMNVLISIIACFLILYFMTKSPSV